MVPVDRSAGLPGCSIIYAPRGQAGEYAPLATNPYRGCGNGCAYCLSPGTVIQMADGSSRLLADVRPGDAVLGIAGLGTKRSWNYSFGRSEVLARIATTRHVWRLVLETGQEALCSADHPWMTERGWRPTERITTRNSVRVMIPSVQGPTPHEMRGYRLGYLAGMIRGDGTLRRYDYSGRYQRKSRRAPQKTDVQHHFRLALKDKEALDRTHRYLQQFGVPTVRFTFQHGDGLSLPAIRTNDRTLFERIERLVRFDHAVGLEWHRGWLAGIFDAEGGATTALRIHNKSESILGVVENALDLCGFSHRRDVRRKNGCTSVRILGGRAETVRFFNLAGPAIGRKFPVVGKRLRGTAKVVAVEQLDRPAELIDITTSTENFVANGMVSHNCYVPKVLRMERREFDAAAVPRKDFARLCARDAAKYRGAGITEQVMLSFTTDPYPPEQHQLTREVLQILIDHGLGFCTLTKGGSRALRDLDLFRPDRDAFACTLTSLDPEFSRKWKRNAALPADRIQALRIFHDAGIFTWVSLEPTLDCESSLAIVEATHRWVDLYRVGRANYLPMTATTDWEDYTHRMVELLGKLGAKHYIKRDLLRIHGRGMVATPSFWPLERPALLLRVGAECSAGKAIALDGWQWRTALRVGARAAIADVESNVPVTGTYYRRGDLLVFDPKAN